jgi:hypothetical protein
MRRTQEHVHLVFFNIVLVRSFTVIFEFKEVVETIVIRMVE